MAQSYLLTTLAGSGDEGGKGDGGMAVDARLTGPRAMACDPMGNCFIAETNRVRRVGAEERNTTFAGTPGNVCVLETNGTWRIREISADGVIRGGDRPGRVYPGDCSGAGRTARGRRCRL